LDAIIENIPSLSCLAGPSKKRLRASMRVNEVEREGAELIVEDKILIDMLYVI